MAAAVGLLLLAACDARLPPTVLIQPFEARSPEAVVAGEAGAAARSVERGRYVEISRESEPFGRDGSGGEPWRGPIMAGVDEGSDEGPRQ